MSHQLCAHLRQQINTTGLSLAQIPSLARHFGITENHVIRSLTSLTPREIPPSKFHRARAPVARIEFRFRHSPLRRLHPQWLRRISLSRVLNHRPVWALLAKILVVRWAPMPRSADSPRSKSVVHSRPVINLP